MLEFSYLLVSQNLHTSLCSWSKVIRKNFSETHMLLINNKTQKSVNGIYYSKVSVWS